MLKTKVGNLVDAFANNEINVMGHCCNAQGVMGSGIAREIADRFPEAKNKDTYWHAINHKQLQNCELFELVSNISVAIFKVDNCPEKVTLLGMYPNHKAIYNLYGQEHYGNFGSQKERTGRNLNYAALTKALIDMRSAVKKLLYHSFKEPIKIGFPKYMGCFRAGGDWNIVEQLIEDAFFDCDVTIYELPTPETPYVYPSNDTQIRTGSGDNVNTKVVNG